MLARYRALAEKSAKERESRSSNFNNLYVAEEVPRLPLLKCDMLSKQELERLSSVELAVLCSRLAEDPKLYTKQDAIKGRN